MPDMKTALVTGSSGFVGRHMARELERRDWDVYRCDVNDTRKPFPDLPFEILTLFEFSDHARFDLIVHAAARSPHRAAIDGQPASHVYNQLLDAAMFEWAIRTKQRRVLYLSSCAVLDAEPDDYGTLKLTGERMARQARDAGVPVTVVRPYSGYGEDQGKDWPFGAFAARARRRDNPFEIWGDGTQTRDWIHVDDVVNGALAIVDSRTEEPVSLCTGVGTSMRALASMMCCEMGYQPHLALRGDKPAGVSYRVGDPTMMLRYYTPQISLEDGVRRALGTVLVKDFSQYQPVDPAGMTVVVGPRQSDWYAHWRVGADVVDPEAYRRLAGGD